MFFGWHTKFLETVRVEKKWISKNNVKIEIMMDFLGENQFLCTSNYESYVIEFDNVAHLFHFKA